MTRDEKTVAAPAEPINESDAKQVVGGANAQTVPIPCEAQNCPCLYPYPNCTCLGHPHTVGDMEG